MLIPYFISVFIHIFCAVAWLGGSILFILLWQKRRNASQFQSRDSRSFYLTLLTFLRITWICLFVLFVTGLFNLFVRGYSWYDFADMVFWEGYFGETLLMKLLLFSGILICAAINGSFAKKILLIKEDMNSDETNKFQKKILWMIKINLLLGLGVLFCAIMLVRGRPW